MAKKQDEVVITDPHEIEKMLKQSIPPQRTFVVRRPRFEDNQHSDWPRKEFHLVDVAIEAHTYSDTDAGGLAFTIFEYDQHYGRVMQRYAMLMAPGTWYDVREVTTDVGVRPS